MYLPLVTYIIVLEIKIMKHKNNIMLTKKKCLNTFKHFNKTDGSLYNDMDDSDDNTTIVNNVFLCKTCK